MVRKGDMKSQTWITAYEDWNVDIGLECGLRGRGPDRQGHVGGARPNGRDARPRRSAIPEPGASCAWVPSPTAATLHATHYHQVDVRARQSKLAARTRRRASIDELLSIPLAEPSWTDDRIQTELDNNAQGILGYVVRWVDQGVGCSKVPDINDIALMEDRATCRISSQHMANWLRHGVVDAERIIATMRKMARGRRPAERLGSALRADVTVVRRTGLPSCLRPRPQRRRAALRVHRTDPARPPYREEGDTVNITIAQARMIVASAMIEGGARGFKPLTVVVLDSGGHVTAAERQDGSSTKRFEIAYGKAHGAISFGVGSRALMMRAEQQSYFIAAANHAVGPLVPVPGGVLIVNEADLVIGAVGVSGDTSDNDELAALAGIEAAGLKGVPG